ncbi:unnamed protein product, partial [Cuscuta epithymum]
MATAMAAIHPPKVTAGHSPSSPLNELTSSFSLGSPLKGISLQMQPRRGRGRRAVSLEVTSAASGNSASKSGGGGGRLYVNFTGFPFPLGPFLNRRTIRTV